ncbi:MAG: helix-turn-helix transcriptional regulator [Firmicutes bacterium]|nr:helix-turn-helix transcriptional regulator [Bacillota bacterium]
MISSQAVSKWETGVSSPDIDMLPKLAVFFGTSVDNLLDFSQSETDATVATFVAECGKHCQGDAAKGEAFIRDALEKYPNNDLLLTCLIEFMQEQNKENSRSTDIIETGERILACTDDDELRIDVLRIMAETYHSMGEQAMAEYYLDKIPCLNFLYYEIAAGIRSGQERLESIKETEDLCIWILNHMLALRKEDADTKTKSLLDKQAQELIAFFKNYPAYRESAALAEKR